MLYGAWIALDDLKALEDLPLSFGHLIEMARGSIADAVNMLKQLQAELPALPNGLSSHDIQRAKEKGALLALYKLGLLPPDAS